MGDPMKQKATQRHPALPVPAGANTLPNDPEKRLAYSVGEFARGRGKNRVWGCRQIYRGRIRVVRDAGRLLIPAHEVRRFLSETITYAGKPAKSNTP